MKKIKVLITVLSLFFIMSSSFAQNDDISKTKTTEGNVKVKVISSNIPSKMVAGQTYNVTVTITNKSKKNSWFSGMIRTEVLGPFQINKLSRQDISLAPGQSITLDYQITAPLETGRKKLTLVFYKNDASDKKIGKKTKRIDVYSTEDDLNKAGNDDFSKDKNKNGQRNKNKESDTD